MLSEGVRRIADEVRNSLDFYTMQEGTSGVEQRSPDRSGGRRFPASRTSSVRRSPCRSSVGVVAEARPGGFGGSDAGPSGRRRRPDGRRGCGVRAVNLIPADARRAGRARPASRVGPGLRGPRRARRRASLLDDGLRADQQHDLRAQGQDREPPGAGRASAAPRPRGSATTPSSQRWRRRAPRPSVRSRRRASTGTARCPTSRRSSRPTRRCSRCSAASRPARRPAGLGGASGSGSLRGDISAPAFELPGARQRRTTSRG